MRLPAEKVKQAILHADAEVRERAVRYFSTAFSDDATLVPLVIEAVKFFKTGKPPVDARETLEMFAFMEAADESKRQGGVPVSIESVMKKAEAAAAAK